MKIKQSLFFSIFGLTSFLLFISLPPAAAQSETKSSIRRSCEQKKAAVVTVYSGSEIGSGSIIQSDGVIGIIITNYHVIKQSFLSNGKKEIYIYLQSGETYTGELQFVETKKDLALVKINTQQPLEIITLDSSQNVTPGESVCTIGSPYNQPGKIADGKFKEFRSNGDLKSSVEIRPGNSGGPLLNLQGKMIGVVKSAWFSAPGRNSGDSFAVSVADALQFIQQSNIKLPTERTTETPVITSPPEVSQPSAVPTTTNLPPTTFAPKPQLSDSRFEKITVPVTPPSPKFESSEPSKPRVRSYVVRTLPLDDSVQH